MENDYQLNEDHLKQLTSQVIQTLLKKMKIMEEQVLIWA
jgi:hypothetical protein